MKIRCPMLAPASAGYRGINHDLLHRIELTTTSGKMIAKPLSYSLVEPINNSMWLWLRPIRNAQFPQPYSSINSGTILSAYSLAYKLAASVIIRLN